MVLDLNYIEDYDLYVDIGRSSFCRTFGGQIIFKMIKFLII